MQCHSYEIVSWFSPSSFNAVVLVKGGVSGMQKVLLWKSLGFSWDDYLKTKSNLYWNLANRTKVNNCVILKKTLSTCHIDFLWFLNLFKSCNYLHCYIRILISHVNCVKLHSSWLSYMQLQSQQLHWQLFQVSLLHSHLTHCYTLYLFLIHQNTQTLVVFLTISEEGILHGTL